MTPAALTTLIRRKTRTTSTTYTDAELLVDANNGIEELAGKIQIIRPEVWNIPATFNLEANKREYAQPLDVLNNMVTLELKFEASDPYQIATALKQAPDMALEEDEITSIFGTVPHYFHRRKAIYVLSETIPAVVNGGRIVYSAYPALLTDLTGTTDMSVAPSTTTLGFPREFHRLLATWCSIQYKDINSMSLNREELNFENDLDKKLGEFSVMDQSLEEIINTPSGASLGDNGFDY